MERRQWGATLKNLSPRLDAVELFFNRVELIAALPCSMCDILHFFSIPWVLRSIGGPNLSCSLLLSMNDPPLTFSDFSAVWRFFCFRLFWRCSAYNESGRKMSKSGLKSWRLAQVGSNWKFFGCLSPSFFPWPLRNLRRFWGFTTSSYAFKLIFLCG